jgi:hypothetical protein
MESSSGAVSLNPERKLTTEGQRPQRKPLFENRPAGTKTPFRTMRGILTTKITKVAKADKARGDEPILIEPHWRCTYISVGVVGLFFVLFVSNLFARSRLSSAPAPGVQVEETFDVTGLRPQWRRLGKRT